MLVLVVVVCHPPPSSLSCGPAGVGVTLATSGCLPFDGRPCVAPSLLPAAAAAAVRASVCPGTWRRATSSAAL